MTESEILWYPSIGNEGYPYSPWDMKKWEMTWDITLGLIEEYYENVCSYLRQVYKWPVSEMDNLSLSRLLKIYEEAVEENEKNRPRNGLSDLIGG